MTDHAPAPELAARAPVGGEDFASAPRAARTWVVAITLAALALPVAWSAAEGIDNAPRALTILVVIMVASACAVETGRLLDRAAREQRRPHHGMAAWTMIGTVLLPPILLIPLVAFTFAHTWFRDRLLPPWKCVGGGAQATLAGLTAALVQRALPDHGRVLLESTSLTGVVVVAGSCLAFLAVDSALLAIFIQLDSAHHDEWSRGALGDPLYYVTEFGVVILGAITALVGGAGGWYVLLFAPLFPLMQQAVLHRPLQQRADTDSKTGAWHYGTWLAQARARTGKHAQDAQPWAVLFADLDHFRHFNEQYGHLAGDEALTGVAGAMRAALRDGTDIGRFGGEEFCVFLPGAGPDAAIAAAERIRHHVAALRPPVVAAGITVSIGVFASACTPDKVSVKEAVNRADAALYEAKKAGRNCCRLWQPTMTAPA